MIETYDEKIKINKENIDKYRSEFKECEVKVKEELKELKKNIDELEDDMISLDKSITHISTLFSQTVNKLNSFEVYKENTCGPLMNKIDKRLDEIEFQINNLSNIYVQINDIQNHINSLLWVNKFKQWVLSAGIIGILGILGSIFHFYNLIMIDRKEVTELFKRVQIIEDVKKEHEKQLLKLQHILTRNK